MTNIALMLGLTEAGPALAIVIGVLVMAAVVAIFFPAVRRTNALFAPVLVLWTLLVTGVLLGGLLFVVNKFTA